MQTTIILAAAILGAAVCVSLGFVMGLAAYHMVRLGVTRWMPIYKANDNSAAKQKMLAEAARLQKETSDMQTAYLSGLKMTREGFLAGERK